MIDCLVTPIFFASLSKDSITHSGKSTFTFLVSVFRAFGFVVFEKSRYSLISSLNVYIATKHLVSILEIRA